MTIDKINRRAESKEEDTTMTIKESARISAARAELKVWIPAAQASKTLMMDDGLTEDQQDAASDAYWDAVHHIADLIQAVSNVAISEHTALRIAVHMSDRLLSIC